MYNKKPYNQASYNGQDAIPEAPISPSPGIMSAVSQVRLAYDRLMAVYIDVLSSPRPNYSLDGQTVSWGSYLDILSDHRERLRQELVLLGDPEFAPAEFIVRGF